MKTRLLIDIPELSEADEERFWRKVDKAGPIPERDAALGHCWVWKAAKDSNGYGRFMILRLRRKRIYCAHRIAVKLAGYLSNENWCLHKCDNPACVNPDHIFQGLQQENMQDMISKRRHRLHKNPELMKGARNPNAALSIEQVKEIRGRYKIGVYGSGAYVLAKEFNISPSQVHRIVSGLAWID